jgi:hypothetical protein
VQISQPISQARAEMKERARGLTFHPSIAIRRSGHHTFEQTEDTPHVWNLVQCCDDVYLGSAGIREASIDASRQQRPD